MRYENVLNDRCFPEGQKALEALSVILQGFSSDILTQVKATAERTKTDVD